MRNNTMKMTYELPSDNRYTVSREWTGNAKPQFVIRFCGEWIASCQSYSAAVVLAVGEKARRNGALVFEAI